MRHNRLIVGVGVTAATLVQAIAEARSAGALREQRGRDDGSRVSTIAAGGWVLDLVQPAAKTRLGVGNDKDGVSVDRNASNDLRCGNRVMRVHATGRSAPFCR